MKHLWLILFVLLISCGKDNKSGKLGIPNSSYDPLRPSSNLHQILEGHWVEEGGCLAADRGRRRGIRERFEIRFYPADHVIDGTPVGKYTHGLVEYDGRCLPENQRFEDPAPDYYLVKVVQQIPMLFTSHYQNGTYEQEQLKLNSSNEIIFRGKRLIRLKR